MNRRTVSAALAWALACGAALAQPACGTPRPGQQLMRDAAVQVLWQAVPAPVTVGKPFALELQLCPATAELLRVDATMPEHRHGMNYRPSLKALGEGRWRAEGLLWHMAGRWELVLDVKQGGTQTRLKQSVSLP